MPFSAPGIADAPVGVKRGIADDLAAIDGVESTAGIEIRDFSSPADLALVGGFELWKVTGRLVINCGLDGIVAALIVANAHGGNSQEPPQDPEPISPRSPHQDLRRGGRLMSSNPTPN